MNKYAVLLGMLFLVGCGTDNTPSESDVKKSAQLLLNSKYPAEAVKLTSVTKEDGLASEHDGIKTYTVKYKVDFEVLRTAVNTPAPEPGSGWFVAGMHYGWNYRENYNCQNNHNTCIAKGDQLSFKGKATFVKTENGWVPEDSI